MAPPLFVFALYEFPAVNFAYVSFLIGELVSCNTKEPETGILCVLSEEGFSHVKT